jgi:hypothetical protein
LKVDTWRRNAGLVLAIVSLEGPLCLGWTAWGLELHKGRDVKRIHGVEFKPLSMSLMEGDKPISQMHPGDCAVAFSGWQRVHIKLG